MTASTLGRAFELYRRTAASRSAMVLLVANAIPIVGVLFSGWSLMTILVLYWLENGIIGFWNVPKIVMSQGSVIPTLPDLPDADAMAATGNAEQAAALQAAWRQAQAAQAGVPQAEATHAGATQQGQAAESPQGSSALPAGRVFGRPGLDNPFAKLSAVPRIGLAVFFSFHYGMFWFVHGIFVFALPAFGGFTSGGPCFDGTLPPGGELPGFFPDLAGCGDGAFGEVLWGPIALAAVALFLSHGASFLFNFIGRGEYLTASPSRQMGAPYGRVIVLHMTIIFGSIFVALLGAPIGALLVLVGLKTAFDLGLHLKERRAADARLPAALRAAA